jgi:putative endonuclease
VPYIVYIVACKDGAFYTGYTRNVKARLKQHKLGKGARYLRTHQPDKIVYKEKFASRGEAMKRERAIKRLTHAQKLKLAHSQMKQ